MLLALETINVRRCYSTNSILSTVSIAETKRNGDGTGKANTPLPTSAPRLLATRGDTRGMPKGVHRVIDYAREAAVE